MNNILLPAVTEEMFVQREALGMGCPFSLLVLGNPDWLLGFCVEHGVGHPCGHSGSLVLAVSPPCQWVRCKKGLCASPAQLELKHPCVISTAVSTNPKHSPVLDSGRKINSTAAKTLILASYKVFR